MLRPKRVLVVDDNPVNREIIDEVLSDDYEVIMAANGPEALLLAERFQPQVVLLDVMLPGMDGYDLCRKLRSMPDSSGARIIMVTAKAMPSERASGLEAGADAYLTKPFDETDLLAVVRSTGKKSTSRPKLKGSCPER